MVQQQTIIKVSDNSGAKYVKCIKIIKGFKKKTSKLGEIIVVSVKELRNKFKASSKVQKGQVCSALIIRTKSKLKKKDGSILKFNNNSVCILSKNFKPIATRIIGPVPKFMKKKSFTKVANISAGIV